ncbi:MAG: chromate efflux transporter [Burkholderiaceae bacterium]|jgi:chromate transporter
MPVKLPFANRPPHEALVVLAVFLRLGLTSFGGPLAHIGYFREEFVTRRGWLSEASFADVLAVCQFLPGPASSQLGIAIGYARAGFLGAVAAWAGFTAPSAAFLVVLALGLIDFGAAIPSGVLVGLRVVAVAVVARAVWAMAVGLGSDKLRLLAAAFSAAIALAWPGPAGQLGILVGAGLAGMFFLEPLTQTPQGPLPTMVSRLLAPYLVALFFMILMGLPLWERFWPSSTIAVLDVFYRSGALVFGGGHVVLPLLQSEVVGRGWISEPVFLAGYGATQAMPGPLFSFAAFLGASLQTAPKGWIGALLSLFALFLPGSLLILGILPLWDRLRANNMARKAMAGINAAVVGLLLAALYRPIWTTSVTSWSDFALALADLWALSFWKLPPWLVVLFSALLGWVLQTIG